VSQRVFPKQWVFSGVYTEMESFLYAIPDCTANTLINIIKECVAPGSTIMTEMLRWIWQMCTVYHSTGTFNVKSYHSYNFVDLKTSAHTHHVERLWKSAKTRNQRTCGIYTTLLHLYLCEFTYRRQNWSNDMFSVFLRNTVLFSPPC